MVSEGAAPVTLITGGGGAIGRATALRLAARGDQVVLADRDAAGLAETAQLIRDAGGQADTYPVDVCDRAAVDRMCASTVEQRGGITYLFCAAGVTARHPVSGMPLDQWTRVIDTHVTGTFHVCQAALPSLLEQRGAAMLLMSSDFAVAGMREQAPYAAAKTAIYSLAKALALEFAPRGVRVNALGPGPIDTPLLRVTRTPAEWDDALRAFQARVPMRRLGRPEEVAAAAAFLLSERAAYITGQLVQPNGGQVMW